MTLAAFTDRRLIQASETTTRHLLVEVAAPAAPPRDAAIPRPPVAVALVLDRSGSMGGEKIALVREAAKQAIERLLPTDRFAVVIYDDVVTCLAPTTLATAAHKAHVMALIDTVEARASTNLSGGWFAGVDQLRAADLAGIRRALLLTDGLANGGITDPERLSACAEQFRGQGIMTTTFGVGADFDEHLLVQLAKSGGGNFYFIEHAAQIPELLAGEVGDALDVVLPQAELQLRTSASVRVRTLDGRPCRRTDEGWAVALGDLVSLQETSIVLAVEIAPGPMGEVLGVQVTLQAANGIRMTMPEPIVWMRAATDEVRTQPRDIRVDRATAAAYASQARIEATRLNRDGDLAAAGEIQRRTARRILSYAGDDITLQALGTTLGAEAESYAVAQLSPLELKRAMFAAHSDRESRDATGRPRRRRE